MQSIIQAITPTLLFPVLTISALFFFFSYYRRTVFTTSKEGALDWITYRQARAMADAPMTFTGKRHPMTRNDLLLLLAVTAVYAVTAFWNLGSFQNPQSFEAIPNGETREITLSQETALTGLTYYPGLGTGDYDIKASPDGITWFILMQREVDAYYWANAPLEEMSYALPQHYTDLFHWKTILPENSITARYLRITARAEKDVLNLGELALYNTLGALQTPQGRLDLSPSGLDAQGAPALFDESAVVPTQSSWENSTYFDEIYHARTAFEHIEGVYPYEITHPPMGKLLIGLGIRLFGMTPFGWRFIGVLFGVGMLPLLYVFLKNLFGKTPVALCGTTLFAFDFMHLTQTRIATIDTYAVFFILGMYFFLYRYLTLPAGTPFKKGMPDLLLSGLFWGMGAASKWTVLYAGVGLALLYFVGLSFKLRDWPKDTPLRPWLWKTLAFSVLCFVILPMVIYLLSYLPYAAAKGDLTLSGLITAMWDNQTYMFSYHSGVNSPHPYSSRWYQWIVNGRPILYYLDSTSTPGMKSAFGAFSNPVVCWGGLLAMIAVGVQLFRRRCGRALFLLVGYFSQLAPWFFISRTTFEYHYFPSILFLVLALSYVFNDLLEAKHTLAHAHQGLVPIYLFTGSAVALYALFYPVLTGMMVPAFYSNFVRWLPSWPF